MQLTVLGFSFSPTRIDVSTSPATITFNLTTQGNNVGRVVVMYPTFTEPNGATQKLTLTGQQGAFTYNAAHNTTLLITSAQLLPYLGVSGIYHMDKLSLCGFQATPLFTCYDMIRVPINNTKPKPPPHVGSAPSLRVHGLLPIAAMLAGLWFLGRQCE